MKKIHFKFKKIKFLPIGVGVLVLLLAGSVYCERGYFVSVKEKLAPVSVEKTISDAKEAAVAGNNDEAIGLYQEAIKKDPDNTAAKNDLAMLYYQTKSYDKAAGTWNDSLAKEPDNSFVLNSAANSYRDQGDTAKAEEYYIKAIDTDNLDSVGNLVTLYNSESKYSDSIALLDPLILKHPENQDLKQLLASTYSKSGNTKKANEILQ